MNWKLSFEKTRKSIHNVSYCCVAGLDKSKNDSAAFKRSLLKRILISQWESFLACGDTYRLFCLMRKMSEMGDNVPGKTSVLPYDIWLSHIHVWWFHIFIMQSGEKFEISICPISCNTYMCYKFRGRAWDFLEIIFVVLEVTVPHMNYKTFIFQQPTLFFFFERSLFRIIH